MRRAGGDTVGLRSPLKDLLENTHDTGGTFRAEAVRCF
jgi:hypothetical protein